MNTDRGYWGRELEERGPSSIPSDEDRSGGGLDSLHDIEEGVERGPAHLRRGLGELLRRIIEKKVEAYMADTIAPPEEY
jgi:hypothetical protein